MPEKLTWDEMKKRYPDHYVLLVDPETDETTGVTAGMVVKVGKDKGRMHRALLKVKAKETALLWTGTIKGWVRFSPIEVDE